MNPVQLFYEGPYFENLRLTSPFIDYLEKEEQELRKAVSGGTALDIGCGNGRTTRVLSDICDQVVGVDFSERLLCQAKSELVDRNNVQLFIENAKTMHFDDEQFDFAVFTYNTFGNLYSSRDKILQETKRVLKPQGKILVSVFSDEVLHSYLEMLAQSGLTAEHQDENYCFLREGLVSERFNKQKLHTILQRERLKADISLLTPISYWCKATRI